MTSEAFGCGLGCRGASTAAPGGKSQVTAVGATLVAFRDVSVRNPVDVGCVYTGAEGARGGFCSRFRDRMCGVLSFVFRGCFQKTNHRAAVLFNSEGRRDPDIPFVCLRSALFTFQRKTHSGQRQACGLVPGTELPVFLNSGASSYFAVEQGISLIFRYIQIIVTQHRSAPVHTVAHTSATAP